VTFRRPAPRPGPPRPLTAAAAVVIIVLLTVLAAAAPARGATAAGQDVPGSQVAAALRQSPVYTDPSLTSAFPASARKELLAAIGKSPVPVYVIAVPLVSGGQWSSSQQLADVVQDDLGAPGVYLTLDTYSSSSIDAFTWPTDPQGLDAAPYHAADAAQAADFAAEGQPQAVPVWQTLLQCIRLIDAKKGKAAYDAAVSAADRSIGQGASQSSADDTAAGLITIGVLAAVVLAVGFLVARRRSRRRRQAGVPAPSEYTAPASVIGTSRAAAVDDLRRRAEEELIALGGTLDRSGPEETEHAEGDLTLALDAYEAARRVLDRAAGLCDLAGVLVLLRIGRNAAAAAAGQPGAAAALCAFNPLHGDGTDAARWRERGGQHVLDVRACAACALALEQRRAPAALTDTVGGQDMPYYEAGTIWAATLYGQFSPAGLTEQVLASMHS
jgi:hypothetical protein